MYAPPPEFLQELASLGIALDPGDLEKLSRYLELLRQANARFNLTAITGPPQMWIKHILDSATLLPLLTEGVKRVIDVGSGAGLPGMPLAVLMPHIEFTLLEATGKKAAFLRETAEALGLQNVRIINERAETAGRDREHHRERYDAAVARAVGPLPVLLELTSPFIRTGGWVLAIKGDKAAQEVNEARQALHRLHCAAAKLVRSPTGTIIVIEKLRPTPKQYPRRPGEPKRNPISH